MKEKNDCLDSTQWNFGDCSTDWLDHCYRYEHVREASLCQERCRRIVQETLPSKGCSNDIREQAITKSPDLP